MKNFLRFIGRHKIVTAVVLAGAISVPALAAVDKSIQFTPEEFVVAKISQQKSYISNEDVAPLKEQTVEKPAPVENKLVVSTDGSESYIDKYVSEYIPVANGVIPYRECVMKIIDTYPDRFTEDLAELNIQKLNRGSWRICFQTDRYESLIKLAFGENGEWFDKN